MAVGDSGEVKLGRQRAPKYQTGQFARPYVRVANVFKNLIDVSDFLSMDFDERDFATYRLEQRCSAKHLPKQTAVVTSSV
jgi:type I restriction enzyme S subunit